MACRVQGNLYPIHYYRLVPFKGLIIVIAQAQLQYWLRVSMTKVILASNSCMVAMCMRDYGFFHRPPWVNIEITLLAKKPFVFDIAIPRARLRPRYGQGGLPG